MLTRVCAMARRYMSLHSLAQLKPEEVRHRPDQPEVKLIPLSDHQGVQQVPSYTT